MSVIIVEFFDDEESEWVVMIHFRFAFAYILYPISMLASVNFCEHGGYPPPMPVGEETLVCEGSVLQAGLCYEEIWQDWLIAYIIAWSGMPGLNRRMVRWKRTAFPLG